MCALKTVYSTLFIKKYFYTTYSDHGFPLSQLFPDPLHPPPHLTSFLFLENKQVLSFKRPQGVLLTLTVRASKDSFLSLRM